jgi:hypothetical protein
MLVAVPLSAKGAPLSGRVISWTSSDVTVATVSASGAVTAGQNVSGQPMYATVTATSEGKSGVATVVVSPSPVARVEVTMPDTSVFAGLSMQLVAVLRDSEGRSLVGRAVAWRSLDTTTATVSSSGVVSGVSSGRVQVSASSEGQSGTVYIRVVRGITAVSAGGSHSMILGTDGSLWGTGANGDGQLGDGTTTNRSSPVLIMTAVAAVSAGARHTMILKTDGTLWATGWNGYGQLGDGTTSSTTRPIKVLSDVAAVSAGGIQTLILKRDGSAWMAGHQAPSPVQKLADVVSIAAARGPDTPHLFVKSDGSLWQGRWWYATDTGPAVAVTGMNSVSAISTGGGHMLALKADGTLWAWGVNTSGQFGIGSISIGGLYDWTQIFSNVVSASAGALHTALVQSDTWFRAAGDNSAGQLGWNVGSPWPYAVKSMQGAAAVSAGSSHTMIVGTDRSLWATGLNSSGQLGDGTVQSKSKVVRIALP